MIHSYLAQMQQYGVRRLLVLSGETLWCCTQAERLSQQLTGDWLWIGESTSSSVRVCRPDNFHSLLGREFTHAVFDATQGFHTEAFAGLAGALAAGSYLVLLTPEWLQWPDSLDQDSLRWSEQPAAIASPNFIHHLLSLVQRDTGVLFWQQQNGLSGQPLSTRQDTWSRPEGTPTRAQQQLLQQLLQADAGVYVLTADRGRGKSALAGMLIAAWTTGRCWITAPNKAAAHNVLHWAHSLASFWSPDGLLALCQTQSPQGIDWLIVDEAAAIPASVLHQLINYFPRVLLTTTVQGYEGTGRGFLLKFCAGLVNCQLLVLTQPIRWAEHDPLEQTVNQLLLMDAENDVCPLSLPCLAVTSISQQQLVSQPSLLRQFYGLLSSAHYRTTPLDLRRLLDAPGMQLQIAVNAQQQILGAAWCITEGGLSNELAHEIWAGRRRPKGNLVVQSLAAHAGLRLAPTLRALRVSRIAVYQPARKQGIARKLIEHCITEGQQQRCDMLAVSFGYTAELLQFWQACGFILVHVGSQKEASSGCYAAMALLPLSPNGQQLLQSAISKLACNWYWLQKIIPLSLPILLKGQQVLTEDDWQELIGFALAFRSVEASYAALQRLLLLLPADETRLRQAIEVIASREWQILAQHWQVSGRKAIIQTLRQEVRECLVRLDPVYYQMLSDWI